jgi:hypothetical protein
MEMAVVDMLMQARNLFDPEPQRQILRDFVLATTDDPGRADVLVPEQPMRITDSVHDAQLAAGTLMQGLPMAIKTGIDHIDYVETLLQTMAIIIQKALNNQSVEKFETILGLQNLGMHIAQHIQIIAQDKKETARVKKFSDQLGKLMNEVKGLGQRLAEQMKKQAQQGGGPQGPDPKAIAKAQEIKMLGDAKRDAMSKARAQRQAERQVEFEKEVQRDQIQLQHEQQRESIKDQLEAQREQRRSQHEMAVAERKARQEMAHASLQHQLEVHKQIAQHAADTAKTAITADQEVKIMKEKAKAQPKPKPGKK